MQHMQGGALPINTTELAELPLVLAGPLAMEISSVSRALHSAGEAEFQALRIKLDQLVFEHYGLSQEEALTLEERFAEYKI